MRKNFFLWIFFCQLLLFFIFPSLAHGYNKCYDQDGNFVGDMHVWDKATGYPFLVKGAWATAEFTAVKDQVQNDEVQFRLGGVGWYPYSFKQSQGDRDRYFLDFVVPNEISSTYPCGPWWTNVQFRYIKTGKILYCDDLTRRYQEGNTVYDFINANCLKNNTCERTESKARQIGFDYGYYVRINPQGKPCSNYQTCLNNGLGISCGAMRDYYDGTCYASAFPFSWPTSGYVKFYLNDTSPTILGADGTITFYNLISDDKYCGGCLACGTLPTPTPTPSSSCPYNSSLSQTQTAGGTGLALLEYYDNSRSVSFTSNIDAYVDKVEIYAHTDRDLSKQAKELYCKIVSGSCSQSAPESTAYIGPFTGGKVEWMPVYFISPPYLVKNESYKLCCKVKSNWGGGYLYWENGPSGNLNNRPRKIYACPYSPPTPTPTPTPTPSPITSNTPTPTPTPTASAWFQTKEGDVHAKGEISSNIPSSCISPSCLPYFSLKGNNNNGVISWAGSESPNFGSGSGGEVNNWQANSPARGSFYNYFLQLLQPLTEDNFNGAVVTDNGVYYSEDDVTIDEEWNYGPGNQINAVIFINGKLKINKKIIIPEGSFLAFIVKGDIEVDKDLGGTNNQIGGFYITDGFFRSSAGGIGNTQLLVNGGVIANNFELSRDLGTNNKTLSAEKFVYRPDFWLNSYPGLWVTSHIWEEIAP